MARKTGTLTPHDFVVAAVAFADEHGLDSMTMRALGEAMGVDATALYRHYPSKDALIDAMVGWFIGKILDRYPDPSSPPRERLITMALASRAVFREHPEVGGALIQSEGGGSIGRDLTVATIGALRDLGLHGVHLVRSYQMFEGYVIGACMQDFARSPQNFAIRRMRYRSLDVREFDEVAVSEQAVADIADEAYVRGLNALLDACLADS